MTVRPRSKKKALPADAHDAVVVGGGPAGLFAALALRHVGARVAIVANPHRPDGDRRTSALLDGSVTALKRLGLWSGLEAEAAPLRVMRLVDDTGGLIRAPLFEGRADEVGLEAFGFNLPNDAIVAAFREAAEARGVTILDEAAIGVDLAGEAAVVVAASGARVRARLVVGADGRNSLVRRAMGVDLAETRYPQSAVTANLAHSRPHGDASTEFHTESGPFTLVPLPGDRSSLVWVVRPQEADRLLALDDQAFSRAVERQSQGVLGRVAAEAGRGRYDLAILTPAHFAGRRACLVGEAAHVVPPIGAQGLNLGLRDGAALADVAADALGTHADPGGEPAMARYDGLRRADVMTRALAIDALNRSLLSSFAPVHALRGMGLWAMDQIGPLRRAFMREGLQPSGAAPRLMRPASG